MGAPQRWGPGEENWGMQLPEDAREGLVCPTLRARLS